MEFFLSTKLPFNESLDVHTEKWRKEVQYCCRYTNLLEIYNENTAKEVSKYIRDFFPHASNFPGTISFLRKDNIRAVSLVFPLSFNFQKQEKQLVDVGIIIPHSFPKAPPNCRMRIRAKTLGERDSEMDVVLKDLPLLSKKKVPYTLIDIITAIWNDLQENMKYRTKKGNVEGISDTKLRKASLAQARAAADVADEQTPSLTKKHDNFDDVLVKKKVPNPVEQQRAQLEHLCASLVEKDLYHDTKSYFDFREEGVPVLSLQLARRRAFLEMKDSLHALLAELTVLADSLKEHEGVYTSLSNESINDTVETHAVCLVPTDDLQARALELLGEIHAIDDVLDLLERSLRAGQLSCDEYVRRVSDVGRKQFVARFLFARVTALFEESQTNGLKMLRLEFPELGKVMVESVLLFVNRDVCAARERLESVRNSKF